MRVGASASADALNVIRTVSLDGSVDGHRALAGNVDPMTLLTGTPDEVACATRTVVAAGGGRCFLVMPDCGVSPMAPLENVVAMVAVVRSG